MARRWSHAAAPLYLCLCLILGGSAQGIFANMILQLLGLGLLAWAAMMPRPDVPSGAERQLYALILLSLALVAIQLVPLPPSIWPHLGGRGVLAEGYQVLGVAIPWLPISVAPYDSLATLLTVIPPLALLALVLRIGARPLWLIAALLAGLLAGILLGILQVSSPITTQSPWYLYAETNVGTATGFFANANHMATLLVISIPFLAALLATARSQRGGLQHYSGVIALVTAAAVVVVVGLALNGSLAGYGLAVPVIVASILLLLPARSPARLWVGIGALVLLAGTLVALMLMPLGGSAIRSEARISVDSRHEILSTSLQATRAFMPLGSGLGTFPGFIRCTKTTTVSTPEPPSTTPTTTMSSSRWRPDCREWRSCACSCCGGRPRRCAPGPPLIPGHSPAPRLSRRRRSWFTAWSTSRCAPRQ